MCKFVIRWTEHFPYCTPSYYDAFLCCKKLVTKVDMSKIQEKKFKFKN